MSSKLNKTTCDYYFESDIFYLKTDQNRTSNTTNFYVYDDILKSIPNLFLIIFFYIHNFKFLHFVILFAFYQLELILYGVTGCLARTFRASSIEAPINVDESYYEILIGQIMEV